MKNATSLAKVKKSKLKHTNLSTIDFTKEEKGFINKMINHFGSGQHPWADDSTFDYFVTSYVIKTINKGLKKVTLNEKGEILKKSVMDKLQEE